MRTRSGGTRSTPGKLICGPLPVKGDSQATLSLKPAMAVQGGPDDVEVDGRGPGRAEVWPGSPKIAESWPKIAEDLAEAGR